MTRVALNLLRALGGAAVREAAAPVRLSDPAGDVIQAAILEARLWTNRTSMGLQRDGRRVTVRVFRPEDQQSDRAQGGDEATLLRAVITGALKSEGYAVRFSDALFCERGRKGWSVVVSAVGA